MFAFKSILKLITVCSSFQSTQIPHIMKGNLLAPSIYLHYITVTTFICASFFVSTMQSCKPLKLALYRFNILCISKLLIFAMRQIVSFLRCKSSYVCYIGLLAHNSWNIFKTLLKYFYVTEFII